MSDSKRKRGVYLASKNMVTCRTSEYGIYKKIHSQYAVFKQYYEMKLLSKGWKSDLLHKVLARLPFFPSDFGVPLCQVPTNTDFVFFRFDLGDRQTIQFLKRVRELNPRCKIIVEVPTYPLAWPTLKWYTKIIRPKHSYCERHLRLYADRIAYYGPLQTLYGIPTLSMSNGIDIEAVPLREITQKDDSTINILSVSAMSPAHGIDRMIIGMGEYYYMGGQRKIILHVVGEGLETRRCKEIADSYGLTGKVIFYGYQTGNTLRNIENQCDIGLEIMGGHRTSTNFSSTLKSREYWAKGMPIITAAMYPPEVEEISSCIYSCPSDESPVDVEGLIRFYDELYDGGKWHVKLEKAQFIRSFAQRYYDMQKAMRKVLDFINGNEHKMP